MTRLSEYLLPIEWQPPADAEAISHEPQAPGIALEGPGDEFLRALEQLCRTLP